MRSRHHNPTRSQLSEALERHKCELHEGEESAGEATDDIEILRELDAQLEYAGTAEGADSLEEGMRETQDVADSVYEERETVLESEQGQNREFGEELGEKSATNEADLSKVTETDRQMKTAEPRGELKRLERAIQDDQAFLGDRIATSHDRGQESERLLDELRRRAKSGR